MTEVGKPQNNIWSLTGPIFLEAAMFSAIGSVDVLMLSRYSDQAVAAVSVTNQMMFLVQVLAGIVTTGTSILCAQYIGAKKKAEEQNTLIVASCMMNTAIGILMTMVMSACYPELLRLLHLEEGLCMYAEDYMQIISRIIWAQVTATVFSAVLRSYGRTKQCMYVSLGMNLCNVILNYIFIFGKFGAPRMGVQGAALATATGRILGFVVLGYLLYKMRKEEAGWQVEWKQIKHSMRNVIFYGIPAAGEQISYSSAQFCIMIFVTRLGTLSVAAYSYLNTCASFIYMFSAALGQGTAILVGWNVGGKNYAQADKQCHRSVRYSFGVSMAIMTAAAFVREPLFSLFTTNEAIVRLAGCVLLSNFLLETGRSRNLIYVNALRASGDVKFPFCIGLVSMWLVAVGLSYVLGIHFHLGLLGIWIAQGADECLRAAGMRIRWKRNMKHIKVGA